METFSALLAICAGNSPVPGEFPTQRPVTLSFDVYFDLRPNERLSKQSWGWWFETLSSPLWRHRNARTAASAGMTRGMPVWIRGDTWWRSAQVLNKCSWKVSLLRVSATRKGVCVYMCLQLFIRHTQYYHASVLTHWGRDKMATIFQTTLLNAFSWMKMYQFRFRFHWDLFLRVQLTIFQHWFR